MRTPDSYCNVCLYSVSYLKSFIVGRIFCARFGLVELPPIKYVGMGLQSAERSR